MSADRVDPAGSTGSGLPETTSRTGLLVGLAVGVPIVAYGLRGVVVDSADTHPAELARWVVGLAVVDDLVVVPAVIVVAWALRRLTPPTWWPVVRTGLLCSAVLTAVAWPIVQGYGADPRNPSLFPRDYTAGLAAALAAVWALVLVVGLASARRRRRLRHTPR